MTAVAVAVLSAIAVVMLLLPRRSVGRLWSPGTGRGTGPRWLPVVVLVTVGGVLLIGASPRRAALTVIVGLAAAAGLSLLRRRRSRREADVTAAQVLEACESLASELLSGQPPGTVLERTSSEWAFLRPVAEAFRVGADVPAAWRAAAERPGAGDLRLVGAAWQVAHRTGAGLAATLDHVVADLRAARSTRRVVEGELASARATAKLVAALPVLALTMGSGAGGDPWGFLLGHPVGLACLAAGLAFAVVGLAWIEALAREVDRV